MGASSYRRLILVGIAVLFLMVGTAVTPAHAQGLYGSISGTITDQSSAVVPNAQVTVTNEQTGLKREATASSDGQYRVLDVPPGTYTIEVTSQGFKPLKKTGVVVTAGQVNSNDLQISVGAVTEEVSVKADAAVLQTEKADVHTTISGAAIANLPLDSYRNFQSVELLAPGVFSDTAITGSYPNSINDTPDRSFNIDANGLPPRINTTRVDGATNIFIWLPNHMLIVPPQETIQEVNVQTSNFDVEKGLTAGVATDVVTKSGTNDLHGSLYGFHTNQHLDARNLFNHDSALPKNIVNNDGFTIGGPIKKNKLFYFGNYDRTSQRNTQSYFNLIPPTNWRDGNFSDVLGAPLFDKAGNPVTVCTTEGTQTQLRENMVFDPTTGNTATGTGRCVFSSNGQLNVIPANRIAAGAANFWKLLRAPNMPGQFTFDTSANDFISKVNKWNRDIYTAKVDWNRTDRHTVWAKYTAQKAKNFLPADYGDAGGDGNGANWGGGSGTGPGTQLAQLATIGHSWTLSPTKVVTGHIGWTRMTEKAQNPDFGKALGQSVLGIPGTNEPLGNPLYTGMPAIDFGDGYFTILGSDQGWQPVQRNDWTLTVSQNMTWIKGKHEIRLGVDASHNHLNHWQPEIVCCPRGYMIFRANNSFINLPGDPSNPNNPTSVGSPGWDGTQQTFYTDRGGQTASAFGSNVHNQVALFDIGQITQVEKSEQFIKNTGKDTQTALYIGDRWKVTPKFTVDVGVRWEYYPLFTRDGAIKSELYDPATNTLKLGGLGGIPRDNGITTSKKLFAPRLGFAYRLNDKTVVRTGAGITYDTMPLERPLRGFYPEAIGANDYVPNSTVSSFIPFTSFQQGIPLIQQPDISSGVITPPGDVEMGTLAGGHFNRGYVESWNFFIQRKLPKDFLWDLGYVGNHFVHEFNGANINAATLGGGSDSQPLAKYNRFNGTYAFNGYLDSHYNGLQTSLQRSVGTGLYLQGSYTYSKAIAYVDDNSWENGLQFNCPPSPEAPTGCLKFNRMTPNFDHTHMLKMAYVYQLPLGRGQKFASSSRAVNAVIGGWQLNGIFSAWNGSPLRVTQSGGRDINTPGTLQTPDVVGPAKMTKGRGPGEFWFDPSTFVPICTLPGTCANGPTLGTAGNRLSWLRGPSLTNLDASIFRHFKPKERMDVEFRFEGKNVLNQPHWGSPNTTCTAQGTGPAATCGGRFGQITSTYGERVLQLGAKITF